MCRLEANVSIFDLIFLSIHIISLKKKKIYINVSVFDGTCRNENEIYILNLHIRCVCKYYIQRIFFSLHKIYANGIFNTHMYISI